MAVIHSPKLLCSTIIGHEGLQAARDRYGRSDHPGKIKKVEIELKTKDSINKKNLPELTERL